MRVILSIGKNAKRFKNPVVVIGVFDGLHRGHQALIKRALHRAKALRGEAVVMTFHPHPVHVLHPEIPLPLLVSLPYRLKLIEELGVAGAVVIRFTKQFARQAPETFIKKYLIDGIRSQEIFVGEDFRFGQDRQGTIDLFKKVGAKYGFRVHAVHTIKKYGQKQKIGSSVIRELITEGRLNEAKQLLGRPVSIMGKVVKGDGRGKTLGFPTANIYPQNEVLPPRGVYAVRVKVGHRTFNGMANIGQRPSFKSDPRMNIEVHIFHFHQNLYGQEIIIEFIHNIRPERIFPTKDLLIQQLHKDQKKAEKILN